MLFCLDPIGLGTPQCEGLTSYLMRLAREHSLPVRRFVSRLLFSQVADARPQCDAKFFRHYAATINGVGSYAQRFAQVMNDATGRTDLESLTFRPWRQLLPSNGTELTSSWRRWCPECLATDDDEESADASASVSASYLRLAWSIVSVQNCSRHGVPLADRCPRCSRRQPTIPRSTDFVQCDSCRGSLILPAGQPFITTASGATPALPLAVAEQLIALNVSINPGGVHQRWIDTVSARIADMGCDRATLCRRVGLNPRAMNPWFNRGTGVCIHSLTKVLSGLQMSAFDVFGPTVLPVRHNPRSGGTPSGEVTSRREHHSLEVRAQAACLLDQAAIAEKPPKLRDIAAMLGTSTGFVRYRHPEKVARLRHRHVEIQRAARQARVERHRLEVAAAVERLRASGVFPGRKLVEAAVRARGASLIDPQNYIAYRSALRTAHGDSGAESSSTRNEDFSFPKAGRLTPFVDQSDGHATGMID